MLRHLAPGHLARAQARPLINKLRHSAWLLARSVPRRHHLSALISWPPNYTQSRFSEYRSVIGEGSQTPDLADNRTLSVRASGRDSGDLWPGFWPHYDFLFVLNGPVPNGVVCSGPYRLFCTYCTLYIVHCTLYIVHCTLYNSAFVLARQAERFFFDMQPLQYNFIAS